MELSVCLGSFDYLTKVLWKVELISSCGFSRLEGMARELQGCLGASWPYSRVVCRGDILVFAPRAGTNALFCGMSTRLIVSLRGVIWLSECRGWKFCFFPLILKFSHWGAF